MEVGKVKCAVYLNNRRLLSYAKDQDQQKKKIGKKETVNGENIKTYIPGSVAKTRGVMFGVSLSITVEEHTY